MDRAPLQKQIPWDGVDFGEPYVFCLDYNCNNLLWTARSSAPAITTARGRAVLEGWSSVMAGGASPGGPHGTVAHEQCCVNSAGSD
jgi:hypothetical protein